MRATIILVVLLSLWSCAASVALGPPPAPTTRAIGADAYGRAIRGLARFGLSLESSDSETGQIRTGWSLGGRQWLRWALVAKDGSVTVTSECEEGPDGSWTPCTLQPVDRKRWAAVILAVVEKEAAVAPSVPVQVHTEVPPASDQAEDRAAIETITRDVPPRPVEPPKAPRRTVRQVLEGDVTPEEPSSRETIYLPPSRPASSGRSCTKGCPCGNSCISCSKRCRK